MKNIKFKQRASVCLIENNTAYTFYYKVVSTGLVFEILPGYASTLNDDVYYVSKESDVSHLNHDYELKLQSSNGDCTVTGENIMHVQLPESELMHFVILEEDLAYKIDSYKYPKYIVFEGTISKRI